MESLFLWDRHLILILALKYTLSFLLVFFFFFKFSDIFTEYKVLGLGYVKEKVIAWRYVVACSTKFLSCLIDLNYFKKLLLPFC